MPRDQSQRLTPDRAKHLERNRIAANKCRQKKKREHQQVQNTLHDETARHDSLVAEVNNLREEIWQLKNSIFAHATCNDQHINQQLAKMAENALSTSVSPEQRRLSSPAYSSQSFSDGSAENGLEMELKPEPLPDVSGSFLTDPALFDGAYDGVSDFGFDRFINVDNI
ncbi:hypothetical protein N7532_009354 [Penicillium argentinense]|uniref:BZIP domain-containing protein n=1 Tax=Penicillium argentinense TaxID=1131581 RepID=A0A9W9EZD6_9EURO|nr:uncharacterized protein N7532_009354 [Penicillium argentinense]KAJ5090670.1 hypothetical protein N7532_009354 [Penicillium argentinense]